MDIAGTSAWIMMVMVLLTLDFVYKNSTTTTTKGYFHQYGTYYTFSDSRLKTQVERLPLLLDKLNELNPVAYEMKNDNPGNKRSLGFIAQEVKPLFPLLIRQFENNVSSATKTSNLHTMNYSGFGVIAIKALQEQYYQIQVLQEEQEILLQRLEALNKKIEAGISANR